MNVHRAAARLAGRELRRRPWRTALVVLLVAMPVAAMVLASSLLRTASPPFDLEDRSSFGLADAVVWLQGGTKQSEDLGGARRRVLAAAPQARMSVVEEANGSVVGPSGGPRYVRLIGPEDDPIVQARTTMRAGRAPRAAGEVALSPRLARAWQLDVGSRLELPQLGLAATVVGIAHPIADTRADTIHAGVMPDIAEDQRNRQLFVDLPGETKAVHAAVRTIAAGGPLNVPKRNVEAAYGPTRLYTAPSGGDSAVRWSRVVGAVALAVFGIVIAAAFAVGARRQLRTLGILACNGASPAALRAVVLWQGAWAGMAGAAAGVALGGLALVVAWPHHDRFLSYEPRWFTVRPTDLVPIVILGALTALLASYQPARSVSRLSILSSLAGRRPLAPVPRRVVLLGLAAMAAGTAFLAVATVGGEGSNGAGENDLWVGIGVLGGLGLLFGSSAVAPAVVGIFDPLARRFRGSPLLALRSLGRQRARTGAIVAAVCAAASLAVAASTILSSTTEGGTYLPPNVVLLQQHTVVDPPAAPPALGPGITVPASDPYQRPAPVSAADLAAVTAAVPEAKRIEVVDRYGFLVGTPEVLDAFSIDDTTRRLLSEHGAVRPGGGEPKPNHLGPEGIPSASGPGESDINRIIDALAEGAVPAPASRYGFVNNHIALVSVERAARHQVGSTTPVIVFVSPQPLTDPQREALRDLASRTQGSALRLASKQPSDGPTTQSFLQVDYHTPLTPSPLVIYVVLDGLALVFTGFVIVVGLALAAAETREEAEVLTAVGASPSTLRRLAAAKAALLAGAGVALAVPTGLLPVWVVRNASSGSSRFVLPWPSLGLLVLVLPATLALVAFAGSAVHAHYRPVTASTMTGD